MSKARCRHRRPLWQRSIAQEFRLSLSLDLELAVTVQGEVLSVKLLLQASGDIVLQIELGGHTAKVYVISNQIICLHLISRFVFIV